MGPPSDRWPAARCAQALNQAIAFQPAGIVLGTIDAHGQAAVSRPPPILTNITTEPLEVARAAASCAIAGSHGAAGVVIFAASIYAIVMTKSDAVAEVMKTFDGCEMLALEGTPLSDVAARMRPLTTALLLRVGDRARRLQGVVVRFGRHRPRRSGALRLRGRRQRGRLLADPDQSIPSADRG